MYNSALLINWMLVGLFVSNETLPGCLLTNLGRQVNIDSTNGVLPGSETTIHCPFVILFVAVTIWETSQQVTLKRQTLLLESKQVGLVQLSSQTSESFWSYW